MGFSCDETQTPPINENSNLHCMQINENKEEKKSRFLPYCL